MAKIKRRGTSGAAKNYVTRNQALKKLQVTLADFRRLCILKGIFPRQPRHTKRANKGSTAPATFYYTKDIAYLQHEPVLRGLREHKAFAKKLSRAIGRKEWAMAKGLEESKPTYRLDHIIKERYPTFDDSLRDIDDALSLLTLFANLPASAHVSADLVANCARLCAQWQLYVMKARALKKVFLSIKGIYFQAEVRGQTITWLVPYMFTQNVPHDVDFRIMSTFLEFYQTLMGFVLFKLYTDANLVYPPVVDTAADEQGAGVGALRLTEATKAVMDGSNANASTSAAAATAAAAANGEGARKITARDVKRQIKAIAKSGAVAVEGEGQEVDAATVGAAAAATAAQEEDDVMGDDFVEAPSKSGTTTSAGLTSLAALSNAPRASSTLFSPYSFYVSRECPRAVLEFVLCSFGAEGSRIGWDPISGHGSAFEEDDERITHHIIDRPALSAATMAKHKGKRVYVQPQWIVDCANAGKLLPTEPYGPGQTLPPHLSPFVDHEELARRGGYVPREAQAHLDVVAAEDGEGSEEEDEEDEEDEEEAVEEKEGDEEDDEKRPARAALLADPLDEDKEAAAELEAEAEGGEEALLSLRSAHDVAKRAALKASKKGSSSSSKNGEAAATKKGARGEEQEAEEEAEAKSMAKMLMSNKRRKLYTKMSYTEGRKKEEKARLEEKRRKLDKEEKKAKAEEEATKGQGEGKTKSSTNAKVRKGGANK